MYHDLNPYWFLGSQLAYEYLLRDAQRVGNTWKYEVCVVWPANIAVVHKYVLLLDRLTRSHAEVVLVLEWFEAEAEHLLDLHSWKVWGRCVRVRLFRVAHLHHLLLIMLKQSLVYFLSGLVTYITLNASHPVFARLVIGRWNACAWLLSLGVRMSMISVVAYIIKWLPVLICSLTWFQSLFFMTPLCYTTAVISFHTALFQIVVH